MDIISYKMMELLDGHNEVQPSSSSYSNVIVSYSCARVKSVTSLCSGTETKEGLCKELQFSLADNSKLNVVKGGFQPERLTQVLEVGSIRRIQGIGYGVLEFLRVGTLFDIFQNIHILYLQYSVLTSSGYGVLIFIPL
ncbi:hypothetical protein Tco_0659373 [Tanacetum coccineum]